MSPVGYALKERFGHVCRAELERLQKKTASLAPEDRARVQAVTLELAQRVALRLDAALESESGELAAIVSRLFAVTPPDMEEERT